MKTAILFTANNGSQVNIEIGLEVISAKLYQNFPNPFNPITTISFALPSENIENIELMIYNIKGQKVKTLECGESLSTTADGVGYSISWNGTDNNNQPVSSGIYFYKLNVNGKTEAIKKCLLLK